VAADRRFRRWIVLPDEQIPFHDVASIDAVERYMADHRWDGCISLGDFLDFNEISRWVQGKPRQYASARIADSIKVARGALKRRTSILRKRNPLARYVLIQGNHDARVEEFIDQHPYFEGLLEFQTLLGLKEYRVEWVPYWSDNRQKVKVGKATFVHGLRTNKYHAQAMVSSYGRNIFYGHTHDVQEFGLLLGDNAYTVVGKSLGCLCDPNAGDLGSGMRYIRGKPQNWQQSFSVFHFWPNGNFNEYTVKIFDHAFISPEGKWYQGREGIGRVGGSDRRPRQARG